MGYLIAKGKLMSIVHYTLAVMLAVTSLAIPYGVLLGDEFSEKQIDFAGETEINFNEITLNL